MTKTIYKNLTSAFMISCMLMTLVSCGPTEKEKREIAIKLEKVRKDSINKAIELDTKKFNEFYNSTKAKFKDELIKNGDFFIDYSTGTIEVPQGCVWKLGKYNVVARRWDTVKVDNSDLSAPTNRERLFGNETITCAGKNCDFVVEVNKLIINGLALKIPSTPCSDYNYNGFNSMTKENADWNRLVIGAVLLPPGTKICVPCNRYNTTTGSHGILTIEQFEMKNPNIIAEFEKIVVKKKGSYTSWNWNVDSLSLFKLTVIGEMSNKDEWYNP